MVPFPRRERVTEYLSGTSTLCGIAWVETHGMSAGNLASRASRLRSQKHFRTTEGLPPNRFRSGIRRRPTSGGETATRLKKSPLRRFGSSSWARPVAGKKPASLARYHASVLVFAAANTRYRCVATGTPFGGIGRPKERRPKGKRPSSRTKCERSIRRTHALCGSHSGTESFIGALPPRPSKNSKTVPGFDERSENGAAATCSEMISSWTTSVVLLRKCRGFAARFVQSTKMPTS